MTALVAERTGRPEPTIERPGGLTLERLVSGVWHDLEHRATAACPVCAGEMSRPLAGVPRGTCSGCGSELT